MSGAGGECPDRDSVPCETRLSGQGGPSLGEDANCLGGGPRSSSIVMGILAATLRSWASFCLLFEVGKSAIRIYDEAGSREVNRIVICESTVTSHRRTSKGPLSFPTSRDALGTVEAREITMTRTVGWAWNKRPPAGSSPVPIARGQEKPETSTAEEQKESERRGSEERKRKKKNASWESTWRVRRNSKRPTIATVWGLCLACGRAGLGSQVPAPLQGPGLSGSEAFQLCIGRALSSNSGQPRHSACHRANPPASLTTGLELLGSRGTPPATSNILANGKLLSGLRDSSLTSTLPTWWPLARVFFFVALPGSAAPE